MATPVVVAAHVAPSAAPAQRVAVQPHAAFDDTTEPAPLHWLRGTPVAPVAHPKIALVRDPAFHGLATGGAARRDPEILGFAQSGEVTSGSWSSDLNFSLLSTIAYFGVNVNSDGSLVTSDSGYAGWWSPQLTQLMSSAHAAGDRVVLTVKSFDNGTIASITGSETTRQQLIANVINQLRTRGGDGVNVDFEGTDSSVSANFTTFIGELYSALIAQVPQQSYLTVDTYASARQGGTMYDLSGLVPHLDAFDLMGYGFASASQAGPTAPLHGDWYNVTQSVTDYMDTYGVPASKLILGVPYYGYKWSVSNPTPGNDGVQPGSNDSADTYSGALSDFACAQQLRQFWDPTFDEPYATWYSPQTNDPCGGNWNSYRELYYDNAQSLGDKYDLVNADGLRGIGIWALGYDSGSNDLWNEIALKFSVTHAPIATVTALPQSENPTGCTVSWTQ
ncbi:MAG: hypothetical protein JOY68_05310, partial [Candidatus Dormibacteraeota bacterium]|nr:hypothetical protein [Candidatus Dormibacteraeota bacterium]